MQFTPGRTVEAKKPTDNRYSLYRIYTSDTPTSVQLPTPEDAECKRYPYLPFNIPGIVPRTVPLPSQMDMFVQRQHRDNIKMEEIHVIHDVLVFIAEYCPAKWYTVSKTMNAVATYIITKSPHVRKQWDLGMIFDKAHKQKNPHMLEPFLRANFSLSYGQLREIDSRPMVKVVIKYEHIRKQLNNRILIDWLKHSPDLVAKYFPIGKLQHPHTRAKACDMLVEYGHFDVLTKYYTEDYTASAKFAVHFHNYLNGDDSRTVSLSRIYEYICIVKKIFCSRDGKDCHEKYIERFLTLISQMPDHEQEEYLVIATYNILKYNCSAQFQTLISIPNATNFILQGYCKYMKNRPFIVSDLPETCLLARQYLLKITDFSKCPITIQKIRETGDLELATHVRSCI